MGDDPGPFLGMSRDAKATEPDTHFVQRYLGGDPSAFDVLFDRYQRSVFFLVRQYFPQKERAEEVFQEVFMKVLERLDRFHGDGSFRAWLFTLSRNHCIDRLRYQSRRPEIPESAFGDPTEDGPGPIAQEKSQEMSSDEKTYEKELARHLQEALSKLPEEQRETFLLKERGGMTFEEIAGLMEVSVNTVKSRMRYALAHLRRALKSKAFIKEALQ